MMNPLTPDWTKEAPVYSTVEALTQYTQTIQGNPVITVPAMTLLLTRSRQHQVRDK